MFKLMGKKIFTFFKKKNFFYLNQCLFVIFFRCVMMIGMPYPNIKSPELKEKMDYLNANFVSKKLCAFTGPCSTVGR